MNIPNGGKGIKVPGSKGAGGPAGANKQPPGARVSKNAPPVNKPSVSHRRGYFRTSSGGTKSPGGA